MGVIDIKLYAMNAGTLALSMTNIEPALKIILLLVTAQEIPSALIALLLLILLLVTIGYTIHRWLELVNKKKNK